MGRINVSDHLAGGAWQFLDFWPESQWVMVKGISNILEEICQCGITRLFWPAGYGWNSAINRSLLEKILRQLCSVFIFGENVKNSEILT